MTTITGIKLARVAIGTETIKDVGGTSLVTLAAGDVIAVFSVADQAPVMNSQQTTVGYRSALNPNWPKNVRAGSSAVSIVRVGAKGVAWLTAVLNQISVMLENTLTWTPPVVLANPASQAGAFYAQGLLTATAQPTAGDTVTINSVVYHFVSAIGVTAGNVLIDTTLALTLSNLAACINGGTGAGSKYVATATSPNASVTAVATGTTVQVTAKASGATANAYGTTVSSTGAVMAWGGATLAGGAAAAGLPFAASFGSELALAFQWQVSADGGSTWSNVSAGGVYGLATDSTGLISTLTVTPANTSSGITDRSANIGLSGNLYRCTATDAAAGARTTGAATLTVT